MSKTQEFSPLMFLTLNDVPNDATKSPEFPNVAYLPKTSCFCVYEMKIVLGYCNIVMLRTYWIASHIILFWFSSESGTNFHWKWVSYVFICRIFCKPCDIVRLCSIISCYPPQWESWYFSESSQHPRPKSSWLFLSYNLICHLV